MRSHSRKSYYRADGTFVGASNVKSHCKINSAAYSFLNSRFKEDKPTDWPHQNDLVVKWSEEEKQRVIEAFEEIPKVLLLESIVGLHRFKQTKNSDNPAKWGQGGIIAIYDAAFKNNNLARVLTHELAHQYYDRMSKADKLAYNRKTGWISLGGVLVLSRNPEERVEYDSKLDPGEDFANNLEYLVFEPKILEAVTPSAYTWLKARFGDKISIGRRK